MACQRVRVSVCMDVRVRVGILTALRFGVLPSAQKIIKKIYKILTNSQFFFTSAQVQIQICIYM